MEVCVTPFFVYQNIYFSELSPSPSGTSAKTLTTLQYEKQPLTVVFNSVLSQVTTEKADLIAEAIFRAVTSEFLVCVPGGGGGIKWKWLFFVSDAYIACVHLVW